MDPRPFGKAVLLACLCFAMAGARAATPDEDVQRIRSVITAQFQAFADDDEDAAFDTATPAVRREMGHAAHFLAIVRGTYPMVYRPLAIAFLDVDLKAQEAWQLMRVVDQRGQPWIVLFALERQGDGSWRIGGCAVNETRWQPT